MKKYIVILLFAFWGQMAMAQSEVMAWGNFSGIRVKGELKAFESSLCVTDANGESEQTGKEKQSPEYHRDGNKQIVKTKLKHVRFEQTVTDVASGKVNVSVQVTADTTLSKENAYFCITLPDIYYDGAKISERPQKFVVKGVKNSFRIDFQKPIHPDVNKEKDGNIAVYIPLTQGIKKGKTVTTSFTLTVDEAVDESPATVRLDMEHPGALFSGLGGNFRLQSERDSMVIDYCLDNMRVAYGRVEMPWRNWQPEEGGTDDSDPRVCKAMDMAVRLADKGMPLIVSAWFPPEWAIAGEAKSYVRKNGIMAYRLDWNKKQQIYQSLADYLIYLKEKFGVEAEAFSFNESDLGIDVLFSPEEHTTFIKEFGVYMAQRGLKTKLLLGDNSDATTYSFILPTLVDKEAQKYVSAVSFHSWRGCDDDQLKKWSAAARKIGVPLIVGEGSTDASAHQYPEIFTEQSFALYEINLYVRLCAIAQPLSILQWQLTSDYSVMTGAGIYGTTGEMRPTRRFFQLKQLASTPENSFAVPCTVNRKDVNAAAFATTDGKCAIHIVNNGTSRNVTVADLPTDGQWEMYVTDAERGMERVDAISNQNGTVTLVLPAVSFVSLIKK